MASASSSTSTEKEQDKPTYPYPMGVNVKDYVHDVLSGSNYQQWKQQMETLITKENMVGFIDGTTKAPAKAPARKVIAENKEYESWKKSNDLVRKWIRDTITEDIKKEVKHVWTAKGLWTRFEMWYGTPTPAPAPAASSAPAPTVASGFANPFLPLHKAAIEGKWNKDSTSIIEREPEAVRVGITEYKETALIVAVKSKKRNDFVKDLLKKMSEKDVALGDTRKRTALHRAAGVDNMEIAKLLVERNRCLPNTQTLDKRIPLFFAATREHRKMVLYLLSVTTDASRPMSSRIFLSELLAANGFPPRSENQTPIGIDDRTRMGIEEFRWNPTPFDGESGFTILRLLIFNGFNDIALALLQDNRQMAHFIPAPKEKQNDFKFHFLLVLARQPSSFLSGTSFNWFQRFIYSVVPVKVEKNADHQSTGDIENPAGCFTSGGGYAKNILHWMTRKITYLPKKILHWMILTILLRHRKHIKEENIEEKNIVEKKRLHDQALKLVEFLCDEIANSNHSTAKKIFQLALFQATSHGIVEIVEHILRSYPNAIYLKNDNEQSIFHLAIECRHEKVFNLIHQVGEFKTIFLTQPDKLKNNALHLAGKLAPQQQLYLKAGPALQMHRELQWFKGVEKLVVPRNKEEKNIEKCTPAEVFTDTHRELVKEGENWMRGTATSCSLVATLIATVVFAAALTVPGGNDSRGHPIFSKDSIFLLFIICDALALFSSITSVLFFLSILSSHYGEEDFLVSLPRRLIFGLVTLFLSILSTMIAFGAIVYLVFGKIDKEWIAIPIIVLPCIPVVLFLILESNLLLAMYNSTYHNIFLNQSDDMLY